MRASVQFRNFDDYLTAVRELSQDVLRPNEHRLTREGGIPEDLTEALKEIGLFGISIPEEYGGLGCSMEEQIRLTFEFCQASCVYRSRFSTTIGLTSQAILDFGTSSQKEFYLPKMAAGECTGSFALTEPEAGSDAASLKTKAERDGDIWVINGEKRYITNAPQADVFLTMARTNPSDKSANGISAFLVDASLPGVSVGEPPRMLGNEGSHVCYVWFENVRVSESALVGGKEGAGLKAALRGINHARLHVAATCVGQAIRLIEEMTNYAARRIQFDRPVGEFGQIQALLADSQAEMAAARALCIDCAKAFDLGGPIPHVDIASAKLFASETVSRIADRAVQILGGVGYMEDMSSIPRLYRDVRLFRIFEGTSQVQQANIARAMLKDI
ncbi:MAG: acyl-CoA dehydrogenase family protein [Alphaproteobacteria bacterium]|jgi:acyl-CoA dehydrogenase